MSLTYLHILPMVFCVSGAIKIFFNSNCQTKAVLELMHFLLCARLISVLPPQTLRLAMDCASATDCAVAQPSVQP